MTEQLQLPNNPNVLPHCTAELGVMALAGNDNALREIIKQKLTPITRGGYRRLHRASISARTACPYIRV